MGAEKFFEGALGGVLSWGLGWVFVSEWCFLLCFGWVCMLVCVEMQHTKREVSVC